MTRVYLGLGSNLGDRPALLKRAIGRLGQSGEIRVVEVSRLFETEPWESEPGQSLGERPWYLNCVVAADTALAPLALLRRLQEIETGLGRTHPPATPEARRFAPRTLDIDILFYGAEVVSVTDELQIPHLLLHQRGFVLRPLADVAPDVEHPTLYRSVRELLAELHDDHDVRPGAYPVRWFED